MTAPARIVLAALLLACGRPPGPRAVPCDTRGGEGVALETVRCGARSGDGAHWLDWAGYARNDAPETIDGLTLTATAYAGDGRELGVDRYEVVGIHGPTQWLHQGGTLAIDGNINHAPIPGEPARIEVRVGRVRRGHPRDVRPPGPPLPDVRLRAPLPAGAALEVVPYGWLGGLDGVGPSAGMTLLDVQVGVHNTGTVPLALRGVAAVLLDEGAREVGRLSLRGHTGLPLRPGEMLEVGEGRGVPGHHRVVVEIDAEAVPAGAAR